MSSSKSLFEDVKEALSNRKLGSFRTPLKTRAKMHKYAKRFCPFFLLFLALFAAVLFSSESAMFWHDNNDFFEHESHDFF